jgi:hypothetical protein
MEELGQLKNPMTSSGIEPATFRLVPLEPQPATLTLVSITVGVIVLSE